MTTGTETKSKSEIARETRLSNALSKIRTESKEIDKLERQVDSVKARMVKTMLVAKNNGATLKEIAAITGFSIGWVQQALVAIGYTPRAYGNGSSAESTK